MLREKSRLEAELDRLDTLKNCHASMLDWQEMAQELSGGAEIKEGGDAAEALESLSAEIERLTELLEETETNLLLSSEEDHADAILEIHPGAGGTEAQDWAQMLQRMYLRWADSHGFSVEELDFLPGNIMGFPTLLIAHIAFNVPYVIFNVTPKLKQLDIKLFEAALDLGCDPRQAFFKVILPEISPAILSGFLISLTYSIDDFMISYFNCGTVETLPIAIYSMTRKKVSPEIYALSTIMFVVILSIILISNAMESRGYRRDQRALRGGDVK